MSYGNLLNVGKHPVDLSNGRVLGHGECAVSVDVDHPHNKQLVADGHAIIVPSAPVSSPRTASGAVALKAAAPVTPAEGGQS